MNRVGILAGSEQISWIKVTHTHVLGKSIISLYTVIATLLCDTLNCS